MNALQPRQTYVSARPKTRQIPRAQVNVPVQLTFHGKHFRGWMNDVSEFGVGVISAAALESGDEIDICLPLPQQAEPLTLHAVVRHTCGFHHGCQFVAAPAQREPLRQFLKNTTS